MLAGIPIIAWAFCGNRRGTTWASPRKGVGRNLRATNPGALSMRRALLWAVAGLALVTAVGGVSDDARTRAQAMNDEGIALAQRNDFRPALEALRGAVALDPSSAFLHNNLGVVLMRTGQMGDARKAFLASLKLRPSMDNDAVGNLADLFAYTGGAAGRAVARAGVKPEIADAVQRLTVQRRSANTGTAAAAAAAAPASPASTVDSPPASAGGGASSRSPSSSAPSPAGSAAGSADGSASASGASWSGLASMLRQADVTHEAVTRIRDDDGLRDAEWRDSTRHIRHRVRPLPRVAASAIHLPENAWLARGTSPFVVTGVFEHWSALRREAMAAKEQGRALRRRLKDITNKSSVGQDPISGRDSGDVSGREGASGQLTTSVGAAGSAGGSGTDSAAGARAEAELRYRIARLRAERLQARGHSGAGSRPTSWGVTHQQWGLDWLVNALGDASADYYPGNLKLNGHPTIVPFRTAVQALGSAGPQTSPYIQLNAGAGHWYGHLAPRMGPLTPMFTSDEDWIDGCLGDAAADPDGHGGETEGGRVRGKDRRRRLASGPASLGRASKHERPPPARAGVSGGGPQRGLVSEHFLTTHWRMLLVGRKGSGMFNHKDTLQTTSYQLQLQGAKRWHLCSPVHDRVLDALGNAFATDNGGAGRLSLFRPDYGRYPSLRSLDCFVDDVMEGEAVFYPREFWHETDNLYDWTVSLSGSLVGPRNGAHLARQLRASCADAAASEGGRRAAGSQSAPLDFIQPSADLCRHYERCLQWWEDGFGLATHRWVPAAAGSNATAAWLRSPAAADMRAAARREDRGAVSRAVGRPSQDPGRAQGLQGWVASATSMEAAAAARPADRCLLADHEAMAAVLRDKGRSRSLGDARRS